MEVLTAKELGEWLLAKGFDEEVKEAFEAHRMDGVALVSAFGAFPGPDSLKDVLPQFGTRIKVYQQIKKEMDKSVMQEIAGDVMPGSPSNQNSVAGSSCGLSTTPSSAGGLSWKEKFSPISPPSSAANSKRSREPSTSSESDGTPSRKAVKLPDPFPIPQFRADTQAHLDAKTFDSFDRKYIVRVLATLLLTHVQKPSMVHCETVAKSLVMKYSFLKEHHSWQQFLYVRCQNCNRKHGSGGSAPPPKRAKMEIKDKHSYPSLVATEADDDVSFERNVQALKEHSVKPKLNHQSIRDLMQRTFVGRRVALLNDPEPKSVHDIIEEFPMFKKTAFIAYEMDLITKVEDVSLSFQMNWDRYVWMILKYALAHGAPTKVLRYALRDCEGLTVDQCEGTVTDIHSITALRVLGSFLGVKSKGKDKQDKDIEPDIQHILVGAVRGTPWKKCVEKNNSFPHILHFYDNEDDISDDFFVAVEGQIVVQCKDFTSSIFMLLSLYYVFNIEYHPRVKDILLFLQEKILTLVEKGRKTPAYLSFTSAIECYYDS